MADTELFDMVATTTLLATDILYHSNTGGTSDKKITAANLSAFVQSDTNVGDLADVTITSIASGEILKWNGSAFINNTLAEAGIAAATHTHVEADITDLQSYITASSTDSLTNKTINSFTNDNHADDIHKEVRNESGGGLVKGDIVYVSGFSVGQTKTLVTKADASGASTMPAIGMVNETIANNADGEIVEAGEVSGIDTSTFSVGDIIYVSTTAGEFSIRPTGATDVVQAIGAVLRSHATLGIVEIIDSGHEDELPNLEDVKFWVGNASNAPIAVAMSGDVTMTNAGVTTVANDSHTHTESNISDLGTAIALVADKLDVFAATTSAELKTVISDETGSGALVFANSPTLVTPALGTPASGVLTNCTGLPEAGLADNAVTLAKMAGGTDGNLITYDASGDPAFVATGTAAQVLTSNGVGTAPTFEDAAAGGGGGFTTVYKTADETIQTDIVLTDDADLQFEADASGVYLIIIFVSVTSDATADFQYAWSLPAGATIKGLGGNAFWASTSAYNLVDATGVNSVPTGGSAVEDAINNFYIVEVGGTAGTIAFQWAQFVSQALDTTLNLGTTIMYKKLN